jgi:hypothetical protein
MILEIAVYVLVSAVLSMASVIMDLKKKNKRLAGYTDRYFEMYLKERNKRTEEDEEEDVYIHRPKAPCIVFDLTGEYNVIDFKK